MRQIWTHPVLRGYSYCVSASSKILLAINSDILALHLQEVTSMKQYCIVKCKQFCFLFGLVTDGKCKKPTAPATNNGNYSYFDINTANWSMYAWITEKQIMLQEWFEMFLWMFCFVLTRLLSMTVAHHRNPLCLLLKPSWLQLLFQTSRQSICLKQEEEEERSWIKHTHAQFNTEPHSAWYEQELMVVTFIALLHLCCCYRRFEHYLMFVT